MVNCKKRKNMTGTVDNAVEEIKNFFHTLQTSENWFRFGVTFSTQEKYYFLDTGTGKIFRVNQQVYRVLECILKTNNFENLSYFPCHHRDSLHLYSIGGESAIAGAIRSPRTAFSRC